jgi:hypothetical protein
MSGTVPSDALGLVAGRRAQIAEQVVWPMARCASGRAPGRSPSRTPRGARRECPIESNAPALMSESTMRLLQTTRGVIEESWKSAAPLRPADTMPSTTGPDVTNAAQPEPHVVADGANMASDSFVGRRTLMLHAGQVDRRLVLVVLDRLQQGRHVLGRVAGLQVRRPVGTSLQPAV